MRKAIDWTAEIARWEHKLAEIRALIERGSGDETTKAVTDAAITRGHLERLRNWRDKVRRGLV